MLNDVRLSEWCVVPGAALCDFMKAVCQHYGLLKQGFGSSNSPNNEKIRKEERVGETSALPQPLPLPLP
jgi:hypothetical protein